MADVFLSYSKKDASRARALAERLEHEGLSVWWDHHISPGHSWPDVIERELLEARCVVALWSVSAQTSQWVRKEARFAEQRGTLVPVLLDDVPPPFELEHIHFAPLSGWDGDPDDPRLGVVVAAIADRIAGKPATATGAPLPPPTSSTSTWGGLILGWLGESTQSLWSVLRSPAAFIPARLEGPDSKLNAAVLFATYLSLLNFILSAPVLGSASPSVAYLLTDTLLTLGFWMIAGVVFHLSAKLFRGTGTAETSVVGFLYMMAFSPALLLVSLPLELIGREQVMGGQSVATARGFEALMSLILSEPILIVSLIALAILYAYFLASMVKLQAKLHEVGTLRAVGVCFLGFAGWYAIDVAVHLRIMQLLWAA